MTDYNVPAEAGRVFVNGILKNALISAKLPDQLRSIGENVSFTGSPRPNLPINWRFAESISALKAFEATALSYLVSKKYGVQPDEVEIDTDHATLFIMSPMLIQLIGENGKRIPMNFSGDDWAGLFPINDIYDTHETYRGLATNIYKTKDNKYYHTHGSLNADHTLRALGMPLKDISNDFNAIIQKFQKVVSKYDTAELDHLMNEKSRQAGVVPLTTDEYLSSEAGKANKDVGLYTMKHSPNPEQKPSWWSENSTMPSSPQRPLAGLKVVDLTRIIAGPTIARSLAEMGASVMRVTSPDLPDFSTLHPDLNWGKWTCHLNLKNESDKEKLRALIREADVVVDGYRAGVMERLGFGRDEVFQLVEGRGIGIVHVRENCYGWNGPWVHRSGWQQISDACCGVSMEFGRAMGNDEPVTPILPNSDYCTGATGSAATLLALVERAEKGGSFGVDVALNYYSQWLVTEVGTYPQPVWTDVWERHGRPVYRHYHYMQYTIPRLLKSLYEQDAETLFKPDFFESRHSRALNSTFVCVKPIARYCGDNPVRLEYNVGVRPNGFDEPMWPEDLTTEKIVL